MKKTIVMALALSLAAFQANSVESGMCDFARPLENSPDVTLNPSKAHFFDNNHFIMESSALLFQRGREGSVPELTQSHTFDGKTKQAILTLNPKCRWSDGEKITAQNYIDSFKMIFDPKNESYNPGRGIFKNGLDVWEGKLPFEELGIHVVDESTLKFELNAPESLFLAVMSYVSYTPAPSHILKDNPDYWENYGRAKVVSGPYMYESGDGNKTVFIRNPYYCDASQQNFDHLTIYNANLNNEVGNLILENKVDLVGRIPARLVQVLENNKSVTDKKEFKYVDDEVLYYFVAQQDQIEDPEIRRAIGLALDYRYLESNTLGYFRSLADSFSYRYPGYNPPKLNRNTLAYETRIAQAREIFAERGYNEENPLKLEFTTSRLEIYQYLSEAISSMLNQLPIEPIRPEPIATKVHDGKLEPVDLYLTAWGSDYSDPENFLTAMVQRHTSAENKPRMLALLSQANDAETPEKRFKILEQVEVELAADQTVFPISWFKSVWLIGKNLKHSGGFYYLARNFKRTDCDPLPLASSEQY